MDKTLLSTAEVRWEISLKFDYIDVYKHKIKDSLTCCIHEL
jgi:hypothetical protein